MFSSTEFQIWLKENLNSSYKGNVSMIEWSVIFGTAVWLIWRWRNETVFHEEPNQCVDPVKSILAMAGEFHHVILARISKEANMTKVWQRPDEGWTKLNADGAVAGSCAAAGGVLRDHEGRWIRGFHQFLGTCPPLDEELAEISMGLHMAWQVDVKRVELQVDSLEAVSLISSREHG
ncbi:hypothetical protein Scep_003964 [Stephania cephalantha]|uniref:RNase H type-1 domain-containing protein n=1 Tax=Stephania cephalantha TaxID=152367 RepID=A0AAP0PW88_9MAGN